MLNLSLYLAYDDEYDSHYIIAESFEDAERIWREKRPIDSGAEIVKIEKLAAQHNLTLVMQ